MENPYLTPGRVRAALRSLDLRPTRGMGQNFLVDPPTLDTIVTAAELTPDDTAVEVGPGLGVLTWELLRRAGRVVAVELDRRLAARLHEEFAGEGNLEIVQVDILNLPPDQLLADHRPPTNDQRPPIFEDRRSKIEDSNVGADGRDPRSSILDPHVIRRSSYKVVANLPYAITSA